MSTKKNPSSHQGWGADIRGWQEGPRPLPPPWLRDSHGPTWQEGRYLHQVYKPQQPLLGRKGGQKAKRKIHQINMRDAVGTAATPLPHTHACTHTEKAT